MSLAEQMDLSEHYAQSAIPTGVLRKNDVIRVQKGRAVCSTHLNLLGNDVTPQDLISGIISYAAPDADKPRMYAVMLSGNQVFPLLNETVPGTTCLKVVDCLGSGKNLLNHVAAHGVDFRGRRAAVICGDAYAVEEIPKKEATTPEQICGAAADFAHSVLYGIPDAQDKLKTLLAHTGAESSTDIAFATHRRGTYPIRINFFYNGMLNNVSIDETFPDSKWTQQDIDTLFIDHGLQKKRSAPKGA